MSIITPLVVICALFLAPILGPVAVALIAGTIVERKEAEEIRAIRAKWQQGIDIKF